MINWDNITDTEKFEMWEKIRHDSIILDENNQGNKLHATEFFATGETAIVDSIEALLNEQFIHVPTYGLVACRRLNNADSWSEYICKAERIIAYDKEGILGQKGEKYVLDIQNGGVFVCNPNKIRENREKENLRKQQDKKDLDRGWKLSQKEVNEILDAMDRKDTTALNQIVHGNDMIYAGDYNGFLEALQREENNSTFQDYIFRDMSATYIVVRNVEEVKNSQLKLNHGTKDELMYNPDMLIASGGSTNLYHMLRYEVLHLKQEPEVLSGFELSSSNTNTAYAVILKEENEGLCAATRTNSRGKRSAVGVAPEELSAYYTKGNPVKLIYEAITTLKPVAYKSGVIVFIPDVKTT